MYIKKGFISYGNQLTKEFNITNVYYPWNRTFEIGFQLIDNIFNY